MAASEKQPKIKRSSAHWPTCTAVPPKFPHVPRVLQCRPPCPWAAREGKFDASWAASRGSIGWPRAGPRRSRRGRIQTRTALVVICTKAGESIILAACGESQIALHVHILYPDCSPVSLHHASFRACVVTSSVPSADRSVCCVLDFYFFCLLSSVRTVRNGVHDGAFSQGDGEYGIRQSVREKEPFVSRGCVGVTA